MRAYKWMILCASGVAALVACGTNKGFPTPSDDASPGNDQDATAGDDGSGSSTGSGSGGSFGDDASPVVMVAASDCKAGHYQGAFTGKYSSSLILGLPLTVTGDVNLTLNQAGGSDMQCMVEGEGFVSCSDVFTLSGGTITGTANKAGMIGDASIGGYPYFCALTGTLDCARKKLVNGWIQCTYCAFDNLTDGGTKCDGANVGGHFAGPLIANYDTTTHSFPMGSTWNGAESLAGNNGMMPGPDGGPISDYLALDGGYGFLGKFGGSGAWNASLK